MPLLLFALLSLTAAYVWNYNAAHQPVGAVDVSTAQIQNAAARWVAYRAAVQTYAIQNPGANPAPAACFSQSVLNLSPGASVPAGWGCVVQTGSTETLYVYGSLPVGAASVVANTYGNPSNVGVSKGGVLIPPSAPTTGITLPSTVPSGAVVSVIQFK